MWLPQIVTYKKETRYKSSEDTIVHVLIVAAVASEKHISGWSDAKHWMNKASCLCCYSGPLLIQLLGLSELGFDCSIRVFS